MRGLPKRNEAASGLETRIQPTDPITGSALDPSEPLTWRRSVPFSSEFELRQGATVIGEMEPSPNPEADATGECLGHSMELSLEYRFFRGIQVSTRVSLKEEDGPGFRGLFFGWGRVRAKTGEALRWRHGLWRIYDHALFDENGDLILRLRPAFFRFSRTETRVMVSPSGWKRSDLGDLILLTWFLRIHTVLRGRRIFRKSRGLLRPSAP
jgi:hypothetical protein